VNVIANQLLRRDPREYYYQCTVLHVIKVLVRLGWSKSLLDDSRCIFSRRDEILTHCHTGITVCRISQVVHVRDRPIKALINGRRPTPCAAVVKREVSRGRRLPLS